MSLETLKDFFFWCMIVNSAVYAATAVATIFMRGFLSETHRWMFAMDEKEVLVSVQRYLSNYKLLITVFNFTPWVALHIMS